MLRCKNCWWSVCNPLEPECVNFHGHPQPKHGERYYHLKHIIVMGEERACSDKNCD